MQNQRLNMHERQLTRRGCGAGFQPAAAAMTAGYKPARRQRDRGGAFAMELLLTLPIIGILLWGLFECSLLLCARDSVVEASRAGAAHAALTGTTANDVDQTVRQSLGAWLAVHAQVSVEEAVHPGEPVSVTVCVPMTAAAPDLLGSIGFSLDGHHLSCRTRLAKQ